MKLARGERKEDRYNESEKRGENARCDWKKKRGKRGRSSEKKRIKARKKRGKEDC